MANQATTNDKGGNGKTAAHVADTVIMAPIGEVWADFARNYRGAGKLPSEVDPDGFTSLKKNIHSLGPLSALAVVQEKQDGGKGKYRVQAGYRRFEAISQLHKEYPTDPRFAVVPIIVKSAFATVEVDGEPGEVNEDGTPKKAPTPGTIKVGQRALESLRAQSENDLRTSTSSWERVETIRALLSDGLSHKEVLRFFADEGVSLNVTTMYNYTKVASLAPHIAEKCRAHRSEGFKFAVKLTGPDYNLGKADAPKWDIPKQKAAIEAEWPEVKEGDPKPAKEKKAKFTLKPQEVIDRLDKVIAAGASADLIGVLRFLVGQSGPGDLINDAGKKIADAVTGKTDAPKPGDASLAPAVRQCRGFAPTSAMRSTPGPHAFIGGGFFASREARLAMKGKALYDALAWRGWVSRLAMAEAVERGDVSYLDLGERAESDAARLAGGGERGERLARLVFLVSFYTKKREESFPGHVVQGKEPETP